MAFDVVRARQDFPALAEGLAHFDGPGGTQVPAAVSDAVAGTMRSAISNRHGPFASSRRADAVVDAARSPPSCRPRSRPSWSPPGPGWSR